MCIYTDIQVHTCTGYCTENGHTISARVGISAGNVVVGALGSLQPRVHVRGDAMEEAERLEQSGAAGMAHISDVFLDLLSCGRYRHTRRRLHTHTSAEAVVAGLGGRAQPSLVAGGRQGRRHTVCVGGGGVTSFFGIDESMGGGWGKKVEQAEASAAQSKEAPDQTGADRMRGLEEEKAAMSEALASDLVGCRMSCGYVCMYVCGCICTCVYVCACVCMSV